jgi:hypothetical protein
MMYFSIQPASGLAIPDISAIAEVNTEFFARPHPNSFASGVTNIPTVFRSVP